ncbi:coiled-coil domain-containing protein 39 [Diachasma alloeum]|uniref:coiled-coil domain-containing protein 39 n=1 Tax=Diachasma alloeum TaxID=454923 RepID=UPI0007385056|nr:coiled-coil domain-containing protein 39 [Diachasma alloeum]
MRGPIEEVLNELGWSDGFRIPVANEENRRLEEEIDRKIKQKKNLTEDLAINEDRVKSIEEYIANIRIEHDHNQKLLTAYAAQHNAEGHIFKVSEHEESSITQEIRNLEKEKTNLEERIASLRKEMGKLEEKLNNSERTVAFDKNKLLQWEEVLNKEEEDEGLLQKYMKSDAKELKNLELKRQKLTLEMDSLKSSVLQTLNEICEMEIILERTANFYVQALEERGQLIERWSQSVLVLGHRDAGIQEILREVEALKEIGKEKMSVLSESEDFLENQISTNRQLEDLLRHLEKKLFLDKEERRKIVETNAMYDLEYQTRKKSLEELSRRSQRLKSEAKATQISLENKRRKIREWTREIEEIKATIRGVEDQSVSAADRLKQLEAMLEGEEKRKSGILKETKRFQDLILRTSNKLTELEGERKSLDLQKSGELKKVEIFGAHQAREEQRLQEKTEMNQKLNFEIQECEMRLGKVGPDDLSRAEMERKVKVIEELQKTLEERTEVAKLLQTQLTNLENDIRKIQGSLKGDNEELVRLRSKKQDVGSMMEGGEKQLKAAQRVTEEKQVAENILELRVTQGEQIIRNIGDKLHNLEKYRLQIDSAMKERLAEIKLQKEGLSLEKRLVASECLELRSAITERQARMQHLQTRYDNVIATMGSSETNGAPVTTTYLKILNAQEKAELQEQGDELDSTIRKTEQEIRSMENTLRIVNACNDKYKSSLAVSGDEEVPGEVQRKQLDEEMFRALQQMKFRQVELEEVEEEYQRMQEDIEGLTEELKEAKDEKELKLKAVAAVEKLVSEQKERISRAEKSLRKLYRDIQGMCERADDDRILLQEKDIATRELQEQNFLALQRVTEFTIRHVEAEVYVKKLLGAKNIALPCAQYLKPSPTPSLCESTRSSVASSERSRLTSTRESASRIQNIPSKVVFDVVGGAKSSERTSSLSQQSSTNRQSFSKKK